MICFNQIAFFWRLSPIFVFVGNSWKFFLGYWDFDRLPPEDLTCIGVSGNSGTAKGHVVSTDLSHRRPLRTSCEVELLFQAVQRNDVF